MSNYDQDQLWQALEDVKKQVEKLENEQQALNEAARIFRSIVSKGAINQVDYYDIQRWLQANNRSF